MIDLVISFLGSFSSRSFGRFSNLLLLYDLHIRYIRPFIRETWSTWSTRCLLVFSHAWRMRWLYHLLLEEDIVDFSMWIWSTLPKSIECILFTIFLWWALNFLRWFVFDAASINTNWVIATRFIVATFASVFLQSITTWIIGQHVLILIFLWIIWEIKTNLVDTLSILFCLLGSKLHLGLW